VAHGTTNPWGLDYDDHGQMFFSNTVIGHLWHVIPGAHYKRMYGEDLTLRVYELIDQHADHYHWDTGKKWHETREAKGETDRLGGGHAHCGLMIYLGDNWPDRYRNSLFTVNLHGQRVNHDRLQRHGSGYVITHGEDFLKSDDLWFRGIELVYGPDGGVYIADWSDIGECHENDGVHRTSGRIYKVTYGQPRRPPIADVSQLGDAELIRLQLHKNDWYVRAARLELQERAAAGRDMTGVHAELLRLFHDQRDVTRKLRAMWALYVTGGTDEPWLRRLLEHPDEHVRAWAVRLLVDNGSPDSDTLAEFVRNAGREPSGLVRLFLASALQRLPVPDRADLASALLSRDEDAADHNLPLIIWYGIEPLVAAEPDRAIALAKRSRTGLVRRFIARRLAADLEQQPEPVDALLRLAVRHSAADFQLDILQGISDALRGWHRAKPPAAWAMLQSKLAASSNQAVRQHVRELGVLFGDGRAIEELRQLALDANADAEARRAAVGVLVGNRSDDLLPLLHKLLADRATAGIAARGLAAYDHPGTPPLIVQHYALLNPDDRVEAVNTLAARPGHAAVLLRAVAEGKIARGDISAYHARQIRSFDDPQLNQRLTELWGDIRRTPAEKEQAIARYKAALTPERLAAADLPEGRLLFNKTCATCHKLFGCGGAISADLTGSNRNNIDYLLENIFDPSAVVPADYRMSVIALKDGRIITGVIGERTEHTLSVQTQNERLKLERSEIDEVRLTQLSLMPDGQLTGLSDDQVRDLIAYLMSPQQVPLPRESAAK
jgi:putative heme-binding domain-containing protein